MTTALTATDFLTSADALALSELIAAYITETRRGAPRHPDKLYVERLLAEPGVEVLGAKVGGKLVGYALFFDLPDILTGRRFGHVDQLYVTQDWRRQGVARRLFEAVVAQGAKRGWSELRLNVPDNNESAWGFAAERAQPARSRTFRVDIQPGDKDAG